METTMKAGGKEDKEDKAEMQEPAYRAPQFEAAQHDLALVLAAQDGDAVVCVERCKRLSQESISARDDEGLTALHYAASGGNANCVRVLLDCGASVENTDSCGRTAQQVAIEQHRPEIARMIQVAQARDSPLSRGMSAEARDSPRSGGYPFTQKNLPGFPAYKNAERAPPAFSTHVMRDGPVGTNSSPSAGSSSGKGGRGFVATSEELRAMEREKRDEEARKAREAVERQELRRRDMGGPLLGVVCCTTVDNKPFLSQSTLETYTPREPPEGWKSRFT